MGTISFNEHCTAKGGTAASSASMCSSGFLTNKQMLSVSIVCTVASSGLSAGTYLLSTGIKTVLAQKKSKKKPPTPKKPPKPNPRLKSNGDYCNTWHNVTSLKQN